MKAKKASADKMADMSADSRADRAESALPGLAAIRLRIRDDRSGIVPTFQNPESRINNHQSLPLRSIIS
jgi:hypothetical protein